MHLIYIFKLTAKKLTIQSQEYYFNLLLDILNDLPCIIQTFTSTFLSDLYVCKHSQFIKKNLLLNQYSTKLDEIISHTQ